MPFWWILLESKKHMKKYMLHVCKMQCKQAEKKGTPKSISKSMIMFNVSLESIRCASIC